MGRTTASISPLLGAFLLGSCAGPPAGEDGPGPADSPPRATGPGVKTPWERYLRTPSPANAKAVQELTYGDPAARESLFDDLGILAVQVLSRDPEAVDLTFRVDASSDGHLGEQTDIMLGRLIRIDPRLFLATLGRYPRLHYEAFWLGGLVGNYGEEYVDRVEAMRYEAAARIAALETVTDPELSEVRDTGAWRCWKRTSRT